MILNCPSCTQILLKNVELRGMGETTIAFDMRCPNCKHPVKVKLTTELVAHATLNGVRRDESTEGSGARIL